MPTTMARQEHNFLPIQITEQQFIRRLPKARFNLFPARIGETVNIRDTAAADDADNGRRSYSRHLQIFTKEREGPFQRLNMGGLLVTAPVITTKTVLRIVVHIR